MSNARGAQVSLHAQMPWLDLPSLLNLTAKAIPRQPGPEQGAALRLLGVDLNTGVLTLNIPAVLRRMIRDPGFADLRKSGMSGFVNDMPVPEDRSEARIGARLKPGGEGDFKLAVSKVIEAIDAEVSTLKSAGYDFGTLLHQDALALVRELSRKQGGRIDLRLSGMSRIMPVSFATEPSRTAKARERDLARLFVCEERVELARSGMLAEFSRSYARTLELEGEDQSKIDSQVELLEIDAKRIGSKINRFLDFCEDDTLARVRSRVGFIMMEAVLARARRRTAKDMNLDLIESYIGSALSIHDAATTDGTSIAVELSRHFGQAGDFSFDQLVNNAYFYRCLPVWPEWYAQVGELQPQDDSVHREIYYRFRVNGLSPEPQEEGIPLTSYLARLAEIRKRLKSEKGVSATEIANLIFLWAVVPGHASAAEAMTPLDRCRAAHDRLRLGGKAAAETIIVELEARHKAMDLIARGVVGLLKVRDDDVLSRSEGATVRLYVNIATGILDPARLAGPTDLIFATPDGASERAVLFENLIVSRQRLEGMFMSFEVEVTLVERSIVPSGQTEIAAISRAVGGRLANIVFQPVSWRNGEDKPTIAFRIHDWVVGPTLRIFYEPRLMGSKVSGDEQRAQARWASQSAFGLLTFLTVKRILQHAGAGQEDRVISIRPQQPVDADFEYSAEDAVYAASQALEHALGRDLGVRVQGIVIDPDSKTTKFRRRAVVDALVSVFPVRMATRTAPATEKIGVITFSSRPCDTHSTLISDSEAGHLILGKAYVSKKISGAAGGPGEIEISCAGHLLDTHTGQDAFNRQPVVLETIRRLYGNGVRTIILVSHRYQGRHVGRSAARHRHFDNPAVLDQIQKDFPDLSMILMVRTTYPAFRLATVSSGQADPEFFEIRGHAAHTDQWGKLMDRNPASTLHGLVPFYSAATLRVVESGDATQGTSGLRPQSGFVSYSLLKDQSSIPVEWMARNNLLLTPQGAQDRDAVCDVLRGIHYLEAELCRGSFYHAGQKQNVVNPVLDPYHWCNPVKIGGIGEIWARTSRSSRKGGSIILSVPAMLARVLDVYDIEHVGSLGSQGPGGMGLGGSGPGGSGPGGSGPGGSGPGGSGPGGSGTPGNGAAGMVQQGSGGGGAAAAGPTRQNSGGAS